MLTEYIRKSLLLNLKVSFCRDTFSVWGYPMKSLICSIKDCTAGLFSLVCESPNGPSQGTCCHEQLQSTEDT
jgi:hypothetical protein